MADSLATRVTRILAGSAHAFLDAVEDAAPEAMMRQAVREIDQVMSEVRVDLGKGEASKHLITTQLNKLNSENEQLATQIDTALSRGEDNLARAGIERQVIIDDQMPVLQRSLAEQQEKGSELEGYITALLAKRREMEGALQDYLASRQQPIGPKSGGTSRAGHESRIESAESAFDRVLARQTGVAGLRAVGGDAQKLQELRDLSRRNRVEERLAQLKANLPKVSS
jgi:phage shock protein A